MATYRLVLFGCAMAAIAIVLILMGNFVTELLNVSASVATSSEAQTSRSLFEDTYDGLAWVLLVLGAVFVITGVLEDRALGRQ